MRVTYFALRSILVGDDQREPGDLVPEARDWPYLSGYIQDGTIHPVLVATLPEEQQLMLLEWDEDQAQAGVAAQAASEALVKEAALAGSQDVVTEVVVTDESDTKTETEKAVA